MSILNIQIQIQLAGHSWLLPAAQAIQTVCPTDLGRSATQQPASVCLLITLSLIMKGGLLILFNRRKKKLQVILKMNQHTEQFQRFLVNYSIEHRLYHNR